MIITAENRTLKLNDELNHPLGPCPRALDSADAEIAEENQQIITCQGARQKNMAAADMIPQPCGRILTWSSMFPEIIRSKTTRERREAKKAVIKSETSRQTTRYINGGHSCPIPRINRSRANLFQKSGKMRGVERGSLERQSS